MVKFTVFGEARGKGRPRFSKVGRYVRTYTDEMTINYETLVKLSYLESNCESFLNGEPLKSKITIYQQIPKSVSKKKYQKMLDREIAPTKKPDIDNVLKSLFDGLNGVAFKDDTQIVSLTCEKLYDVVPRVEVVIERIEGVDSCQ